MRSRQAFVRSFLLVLALAVPTLAQVPSATNSDGSAELTLLLPFPERSRRPGLAIDTTRLASFHKGRVEHLVRASVSADSATRVKPNRGLGAVIGGGIGLIVGGIYGYRQGDERVPFDQATGAALYGGVSALLGAILGAAFAPRVP